MGLKLNNREKIAYYYKQLREKSGGDNLPFYRQIFEIFLLFLFRRNGPGYYYQAGFNRKEIKFTDKLCHLNAKEYNHYINSFNPPQYQKFSQHKLVERAILNLLGYTTPKYLGAITSGRGRSVGGIPFADDLSFNEFLINCGESKICFKLMEGWAGIGFLSYELQNNNNHVLLRRLDSDTWVESNEIWRDLCSKNSRNGLLIEAYVEQEASYALFNPSSLNTMRLWTIQRDKNCRAEVVLGYLRIGREGSMVDNQSAGGIVAPINIKDGSLSSALDGEYTRKVYPVHPDHGAQIEGVVLHRIDEAIRLAEDCLTNFPILRFAGFDIAMSDNDPLIIELNVSPDRQGAAFVDFANRHCFEP